MQTSNIYTLEQSKVNRSNFGLLNSAISRLGDASAKKKISNVASQNTSPQRMKLFRDSPKRQKGLDGLLVSNYQPKTSTQGPYNSIYRSSSPNLRTQQKLSPYRESPTRSKQKLDRFRQWDQKLDIELHLQNHSIAKLNDQHTIFKSAIQSIPNGLGERLAKVTPSVPADEIITLTHKLNTLPRSEMYQFSKGHQQELISLHQTITRIMRTNKAF